MKRLCAATARPEPEPESVFHVVGRFVSRAPALLVARGRASGPVARGMTGRITPSFLPIRGHRITHVRFRVPCLDNSPLSSRSRPLSLSSTNKRNSPSPKQQTQRKSNPQDEYPHTTITYSYSTPTRRDIRQRLGNIEQEIELGRRSAAGERRPAAALPLPSLLLAFRAPGADATQYVAESQTARDLTCPS